MITVKSANQASSVGQTKASDQPVPPIAESVDQTGSDRPSKAKRQSTWLAEYVCQASNLRLSCSRVILSDTLSKNFCGLLCYKENLGEEMNLFSDESDTEGAVGGIPNPATRVKCPNCEKTYSSERGLKKHAILHHEMRYDAMTQKIVPFDNWEDFQRARTQAQKAQMSAGQRRRMRKKLAATPVQTNDLGEKPPRIYRAATPPATGSPRALDHVPRISSSFGDSPPQNLTATARGG